MSGQIFVVTLSSQPSYPKYFKIAKCTGNDAKDRKAKLKKLQKGHPQQLVIVRNSAFPTDDPEEAYSDAIGDVKSQVQGIEFCKRGWFKYTSGDPMPTVCTCVQQAAADNSDTCEQKKED